jgi:spermidine/putrescine transport system substrate-binding protein
MNQLNRRSFLALSAMAASLAACGGDDSDGASSATTGDGEGSTDTTAAGATSELEGTLNFLNFPGWVGATTYEKFTAMHPGVTINEIPIGGSDGVDYLGKIQNRAGDYDLILVDGTTFPKIDALDGFGTFDGMVPNLSLVDEPFRGQPFDPNDERWAATDYGRTGIAYRRDLVPEAPTSWAEFFAAAPAHSGKVAVLDYQRSVMGSILRYLELPSSTVEQADLDAVRAVLVDELKPYLLAVSTEVGRQLVTGEVAMAFGDAYDIYTAAQENPDIVWVDPSEGQVAYIEGLAVLDGPRNDIARAFIDFHLSKEQYADFINTVNSAGVQTTNDLILPELLSSPMLNPSLEVAGRIEYHQDLGEAEELWQQVWDSFKSA